MRNPDGTLSGGTGLDFTRNSELERMIQPQLGLLCGEDEAGAWERLFSSHLMFISVASST